MLVGLVACAPAFSVDFTGPVHVIDGDTVDVGDTRVRLFGIDAPEQDQTCVSQDSAVWACGAWVTDATREFYDGKIASCMALDTDRYGRVVARCKVGGQDVARQLVQDGLAFAYLRYSRDYEADESRAAAGKIGLHASRVQSPAQFRQTRGVANVAPDDACRIKGNISRSGERIFHVPGQRDYNRTNIRPQSGEKWFCSSSQARAAGWRAARR